MSKPYGDEEKEMCQLLDRMTANSDFWNDKVPLVINFQRFGFQLRELDFERETVYHNDFPLRNRNQAAIANSGLSVVKNDKKEFKIRLDVWPFDKNDISVFSVPGKYIFIQGEHGERDEDGSIVSRKFQRYYRVPRGSVTDINSINCEYFGDKTITVRIPKGEVSEEKGFPINLASCRNRPIPTDKQYSEEMPEAQKVTIIEQSETVKNFRNIISIEDSKKEESSKSEGEHDQGSTEGVSDIAEDSKSEESSKSEIKIARQSPEGLSEQELLSATKGDGQTDQRVN